MNPFKIDQHTCSPRGVSCIRALPFLFLILNPYAYLQPLRMSGAHIFPNTHGTAVNGSTFYAADSVSGTDRYQPIKLIVWISGRCTSRTSTMAIGRRPMGSFPLCQIRAIGSQAAQKSSPNSRGIFPTQMTQFRRESSFCCMEWEVSERLRFA